MENLIMVAIVAFYTVLTLICIWSMYHVYKAISEIFRDMLEEINEIGKENENGKEQQKEKENSAGDTEE